MKDTEVIGIGSAFVDYFFEVDKKFLKRVHLQSQHSRAITAGEFTQTFSLLPLLSKSVGGSTLITLSILETLGINVQYSGIIGNDEDGVFLRNQIKSICGRMWKKGNTATSACLLTNERKHRSFLYTLNDMEIGFFERISASPVNTAKFLHITPIYATPQNSLQQITELVSKLHGPRISFCPAFVYTSLGLKKLAPVLKKTDVVFFSREELEILFSDIKKGSKELLKFGPKIIVCTLDKDGALITTKEKQFVSPGKKVKKIIDTTGAGDAFAAGFLYGLLKNKSLEWSAEFANIVASKAITDFGLHWLKNVKREEMVIRIKE